MKAMSLRISMATLSPCLTPSFCKPLAMRSARSATSSWLRLRGPLMMPRKLEVDIVAFRSVAGFEGCAVIPARCAASNPESRDSGSGANAPSRSDGKYLPRLRKPRRTLFHIGAHGFGLVGAAKQFLLLDG